MPSHNRPRKFSGCSIERSLIEERHQTDTIDHYDYEFVALRLLEEVWGDSKQLEGIPQEVARTVIGLMGTFESRLSALMPRYLEPLDVQGEGRAGEGVRNTARFI